MWDLISDEFFSFTLNADVSYGANIKTAKGIDHSFNKLNHPNCRNKLVNNATDTGGGSAHIRLQTQLITLSRMFSDSSCHACSINGINLTFANLVTKYFRVSSMKNHSYLQLIFTYYALEQEFKHETLQYLQQEVINSVYKYR